MTITTKVISYKRGAGGTGRSPSDNKPKFPGGSGQKNKSLMEFSKKFGVQGVADFESIAEIE